MKVAVYSIAKNEEQFVAKWVESAKDADMILLADTGSTDNTVKIAKSLGATIIEIKVKPWRFDKARNKSLQAIPQDYDYCIALDLDEVLVPGWRRELEIAHALGVTRPRYKYVWSWKADGSEGLVYGGDKIHHRHGYTWKHPVHEALKPTKKENAQWCGVQIHHHPDNSKPRSQYLPLLELSVKEDPHNDRNAHYYARELLIYDRKDEAYKEFERHLNLPTAIWKPERANSYRYMSKCVDDLKLRESLLFACVSEYPEGREGWVMLAQHYYEIEDWHGCFFAAGKAIRITEMPLEYFNEEWAWDGYVFDVGSIAAFHLGQDAVAVEWCEKALVFSPDDERLNNNLIQFKEAFDG